MCCNFEDALLSYCDSSIENNRMIEAGVDPETAERGACRIKHVISQESF